MTGDTFLFDLSGRIAVVTGGNGGIGRAMALGLARAGASVAVLARNEEKNQRVLAELKQIGRSAMVSRLDVTDRAALAPAVAQVERTRRHRHSRQQRGDRCSDWWSAAAKRAPRRQLSAMQIEPQAHAAGGRGEAQVVWTTLVSDLETPVSAFLKTARVAAAASSWNSVAAVRDADDRRSFDLIWRTAVMPRSAGRRGAPSRPANEPRAGVAR